MSTSRQHEQRGGHRRLLHRHGRADHDASGGERVGEVVLDEHAVLTQGEEADDTRVPVIDKLEANHRAVVRPVPSQVQPRYLLAALENVALTSIYPHAALGV